jgi:hypothetical protein
MMITKVTGVNKVIAKLKAADKTMQVGFMKNLYTAGLFLQRESQKIVPIDKTNLKGSAFTRLIKKGWASDCIVGYTSKYAIYVHENLDAAHGAAYNIKYAKQIANNLKGFKKKKPEEQAKFLEKPFREKRKQILTILWAGK